MKKIISIMLIAVLITIGNLNDVKGEEIKSEKYIFNDNCLEQVIINNNVVVKNKYNESGYRIWKQGEEISSFIYNEQNLLVKEIRNEKIIEYLYEYNYNYKFYMVSGFIYDGDKYLYERDEKNRISGIVDNDNEEIAKYEYMDNTDFVLNVLKYVNCSWEECEDKQFIGNINKIRNICAYLDDETELYYENGVFFDALTNKVIKENNNIVSIFCDEDDTSMFLEGYIYAIGRQDFLIKHITPHGLADGYILKKIDSVMHLEISGQYEKKIEKLYSKKNQRHIDLKLQDKVSLKNNIFQICMNNKYIVSIEMIQDDECPIKGVINKIDDNKVIVSKLTEYGEDDGEAILKKENIDTISFLGVDEEDIQLLKRK